MKTLEQIESELKAKGFENKAELYYHVCEVLEYDDYAKLTGYNDEQRVSELWNKWHKDKETPTIEEQKQALTDFIEIASDEAIIKLYLTYAEIRGFEEETITKEEAEQRLKELTGSNYKIK